MDAIILKKLVCGSVMDGSIVKKKNAGVWLKMPRLTNIALPEVWA